MAKLEKYLDQVCRSIGGPVEMRQHVRQELREHLLDAVAQHKAAGLPEEAALDKALEEFGKPEEVRSDLEAAYGQRMTWILDKAMQWKERTMKAKWLWMTWAVLAPTLVIALEVLFITFNVVFITPKFNKLTRDGIIDPVIIEEQGASWMPAYLDRLSYVGGHYTTFLLLGAIAAVGLFEWRVKSENKAFIRLSALGTVAVGLMVVIIFMSGSLVVSFTLGVPAIGRISRPFAVDQVAKVETSVSALEQALAKKDWAVMPEQTDGASQALGNLAKTAPVVRALAFSQESATVRDETQWIAQMRTHLQAASEDILEARQAIGAKDAGRLEVALRKFHEDYGPVGKAAKRLQK
jgi:hypothetical protein